jgi:hypothetical protein
MKIGLPECFYIYTLCFFEERGIDGIMEMWDEIVKSGKANQYDYSTTIKVIEFINKYK